MVDGLALADDRLDRVNCNLNQVKRIVDFQVSHLSPSLVFDLKFPPSLTKGREVFFRRQDVGLIAKEAVTCWLPVEAGRSERMQALRLLPPSLQLLPEANKIARP
jgi:hypothetical protein